MLLLPRLFFEQLLYEYLGQLLTNSQRHTESESKKARNVQLEEQEGIEMKDSENGESRVRIFGSMVLAVGSRKQIGYALKMK